jgi:hypothetical protein
VLFSDLNSYHELHSCLVRCSLRVYSCRAIARALSFRPSRSALWFLLQDVLRTFKLVAQRVMDGFDTTIAEDDALLKDPTLTMNQVSLQTPCSVFRGDFVVL